MSRREYKQEDAGSKIYIYYTSKMVTNIEERAGYDFSQFVADMGGSLGFLLGLSVIGLIVVLEKLLGIWFLNKFVENYKAKKLKNLEEKAEIEKQKNKFWDKKLQNFQFTNDRTITTLWILIKISVIDVCLTEIKCIFCSEH